jgi:PHD/YefM family antitoxin component YafN of YafNO toxin-antitoxin module
LETNEVSLVELIVSGRLAEAKEVVFARLDVISSDRLQEEKIVVGQDTYTMVEEVLDEASTNVIKMGRIKKIRRRIRRNAQGRIVVQKNVRKSAIKGYRVSGNSVKRIPAIQRIQKARKLKRYWQTKGKAKLRRTLLKRKMSIRRRTSMGIK